VKEKPKDEFKKQRQVDLGGTHSTWKDMEKKENQNGAKRGLSQVGKKVEALLGRLYLFSEVGRKRASEKRKKKGKNRTRRVWGAGAWGIG